MLKKIICFTLLISFLSVNIAFGREGMSVINGDGKTSAVYYYETDSGILKNQWKQVWDNWYYFDEEGRSKQNTWFQDSDDKWYYFNEWSVMETDATTPDGYYVGADGVWVNVDN